MQQHHKNPRLFGFTLVCGFLGILIGGTAALAEDQKCMQAAVSSPKCLKTTTERIIENSTAGLFAGTFAALSISWRQFR